MSRRVVITGCGLLMPGARGEELWNDLLAGTSYIHRLDERIAAAFTLDRWHGDWFAATPGEPTIARRIAAEQLALAAATPLIERAGLRDLADPDWLGLAIGGSKGMIGLRDAAYEAVSFPGVLSPTAPLDAVAASLRCGRTSCPVAACATGLVSLIQAARWIRWNECDIALAGSADASINPAVLASYRRMGVLSAGQPSPFGQDRDGFVIGEGAGLLVMEEEQVAINRGRQPIAVWSGEDMRADATALVQTDLSGEAVAVAAAGAIRSAGLVPADIDAICLHGTGTPQNDVSEGRGLRAVFGKGLDTVPAFSVKGQWGHALGAAGALEAAACVLAIRDQTLPPHVGHGPLDPECEITNVAAEARPMRLRHILKLSLGFGGHIAAAVISQP